MKKVISLKRTFHFKIALPRKYTLFKNQGLKLEILYSFFLFWLITQVSPILAIIPSMLAKVHIVSKTSSASAIFLPSP